MKACAFKWLCVLTLNFLWGGCVWIMLNVRLCFFFFYERVCFVVVFVCCCWRCLIRTHTVCVSVRKQVIKQKCICALRVSLWFMEGFTAFQESVLSVWHSREAPCCCQGPQREKKWTWEFQTPTLKLLEHSIWGFLFSYAYLLKHSVSGGGKFGHDTQTRWLSDCCMDRWFQVNMKLKPHLFC